MRQNALLPLVIIPLALVACKKEPETQPLPQADFTFEKLSTGATKFTNASTNAASYRWNFGDGESSTEANPTRYFPYKRTYQVTLEANGSGGTHTVTKSVDLNVLPVDQAMAVLNQLAGTYRLTKRVDHRVNHPGPYGGVWDDVAVIDEVISFRVRDGILEAYSATLPAGNGLNFASAGSGYYFFPIPGSARSGGSYSFRQGTDSIQYNWFSGGLYDSSRSTKYGKKIP